jgi:hypothetical protein
MRPALYALTSCKEREVSKFSGYHGMWVSQSDKITKEDVLYICVSTAECVCVYVCIYMCVYVCIYVCICMCIYMCVCVCVYVYIHLLLLALTSVCRPSGIYVQTAFIICLLLLSDSLRNKII